MKATILMCIVTAVVSTFATMAFDTAYAAVPGTCNLSGNYLATANSGYSTNIRGARARIEYNNPDLCGDDSTGEGVSVAWSMVSARSDSDLNNTNKQGWAQTGYGQFAANSGFEPSGLHVFAQYKIECKSTGTCTGDTVNTQIGGGIPSPGTYANELRSSDDRIHMSVNGTDLLVTDYDPTGSWDEGWRGQFAGEVLDPKSNVPGTDTDRTTFDYLYYLHPSGSLNFFGSITALTPNYSRHHVRVYNAGVGGKGVDVWTSPLNSF